MNFAVVLLLAATNYSPWHTPAQSPHPASVETHGPAANPPVAGAVLTIPVEANVSSWKYDGERDGYHWYRHRDGATAAAVLGADGKTTGHWLYRSGSSATWVPYGEMPARASGFAPRGLFRRPAVQSCPTGTCPTAGG